MIYKFSKSKVVVATLLLLSTMMINKTSAMQIDGGGGNSDNQDSNLEHNNNTLETEEEEKHFIYNNESSNSTLQKRKLITHKISYLSMLVSGLYTLYQGVRKDNMKHLTLSAACFSASVAVNRGTKRIVSLDPNHLFKAFRWSTYAATLLNGALYVMSQLEHAMVFEHKPWIKKCLGISSALSLGYFAWDCWLSYQGRNQKQLDTDYESDSDNN